MSARGKGAMSAGEKGATSARDHTAGMRTLHWITAALVLAAYLAAWAIEDAATPAQGEGLMTLHRSLGLAILGLTALRLAWRRRAGVPPLPPDLPRTQRLAARAGVAALYALLLAQPLLGLAASLLHGDRVLGIGGLAVPSPLPVNRTLAHGLFVAHGWVAMLLLATVGAHAAAALHHHLIRRDGVLAGMLPWAARRRAPADGASAPGGAAR